MATKLDDKLNPGQSHADDTFDFDRHERELAGDEKDLAPPDQENENASRARTTLAEREGKAGQDEESKNSEAYDTRTAAEREAAPFQYTPDTGQEDSGNEPSKGKKRLRLWLTIAGVLGLVGGGATFYGAISGLPITLAEQAAKETRERIGNSLRDRAKPYVFKFLAKFLGDSVAINNCVNDKNPAPMVTKDCFYRHRKEYPKTIVGRAWQAWRDGKMAKRMVEAGMGMEYHPGGGGKPAKWVLSIASGESYDISIDNPEGDMERLSRSGATRGRVGEIQREFMAKFRQVTRAGLIERMRMKHYWERQFNLNACNHICIRKERAPDHQSTIAAFRNRLLGLIAIKVTHGSVASLAWACMLSRSYSCSESDSNFREQYRKAIETTRNRVGDGRIETALKLADEAKNSGKSLPGLYVTKFMQKIVGKATTAFVGGTIPVAGQVYGTFVGLTLAYIVYDVLSSESGQYMVTLAKDEGFVGAANLIAVAADERKGAQQVYDLDADAAYNERLAKGASHSLAWQSLYGNVEGLKNYQALFGDTTAYAATLDPNVYPNTCPNGQKLPANHLVCPEMQYDYTPPILAAAQSVAIPPGDLNQAIDVVADVASDIVETINVPADAATEAAINTPAGQQVSNAISGVVEPIATDITEQVLMPPIKNTDDLRDGLFLDAAWAGLDRTYNLMARGGLQEDGTPYGWGRVLTDAEVQEQSVYVRQQINEDFARLPLWDRIFSIDHTQSFATRFALAAPTSMGSPFQFVASALSPLTGMRFAALTQSAAHAEITPATNFFHIPQYGFGTESEAAPPRDENDASPCPNDRTPLNLNDPAAIDRGTGMAEFPKANFCLADQESLLVHSALDSGEPLDPRLADGAARANIGGGSGVATGKFKWPIAESDYSHASSCFGATAGRTSPHAGLDMLGKKGDGETKILAADGGEVVVANKNSDSAGGFVVIKHRSGLYSFYMHMYPDLKVKVGDPVGQGDVLGRQGYYGDVSPPGPGGSHLHFAIGSKPIHQYSSNSNPLNYLPFTGVYKANNPRNCTPD